MAVDDALLEVRERTAGRAGPGCLGIGGPGQGERERGDAVVQFGREGGGTGHPDRGEQFGRMGVRAAVQPHRRPVPGRAEIVRQPGRSAQHPAVVEPGAAAVPVTHRHARQRFVQQRPPQAPEDGGARRGQRVGVGAGEAGAHGGQFGDEGCLKGARRRMRRVVADVGIHERSLPFRVCGKSRSRTVKGSLRGV